MTRISFLQEWQAFEFEYHKPSRTFYIWTGIFLVIMIAYALFSNSPIMAITFILIGLVGYIYQEKEPRVLRFAIGEEGVVAGKEIYIYDNLDSFWIIYTPQEQYISLKTTSSLTPYVKIPLGETNPMEIRELLLHFIPEKKHEPRMVDIIEKLLHI